MVILRWFYGDFTVINGDFTVILRWLMVINDDFF